MKQMVLGMVFFSLAIGACQTSSLPAPVPEKLNRIVIAGDSTAADYPPERIGQIGWGQALPYFLPTDMTVLNLAVNGRSTRSYLSEGKWENLVNQIGPGDLVLISFGHNDSRDDDPERFATAMGAYKENLERFVADVRRAKAEALILSPAARRLWEGPAMVETHGLYRLAAEEAASETGSGFIDLSSSSLAYFEGIGQQETKQDFVWLTRPNWKTGRLETLEDNTHFSLLGACGVAHLIALELEQMNWVKLVHSNENNENQIRPAIVSSCAREVEHRSNSTLK